MPGLTTQVPREKNEDDKMLFKSPVVAQTWKNPPVFHDGRVDNLEEAVRIIAKLQLDVDLSDQEVAEIVAFLKTLTGNRPADLRLPADAD